MQSNTSVTSIASSSNEEVRNGVIDTLNIIHKDMQIALGFARRVESDPSDDRSLAGLLHILNQKVADRLLDTSVIMPGSSAHIKLQGIATECLTLEEVVNRLQANVLFRDIDLSKYGVRNIIESYHKYENALVQEAMAKESDTESEGSNVHTETAQLGQGEEQTDGLVTGFTKVKSKRKSEKKKQRSAKKVVVAIDYDPVLDKSFTKTVSNVESTEDVAAGQCIFTPKNLKYMYVHVPAKRIAMHEGKPATRRMISAGVQCQWVDKEPEVFIKASSLDRVTAWQLANQGLITESSYRTLIEKLPEVRVDPPVSITREEAIATGGVDAVMAAEIEEVTAKCLQFLKMYNLSSKANFVCMWMKRLLYSPEPLDPVKPARAFLYFLRKTGGQVTEVNKTFYSLVSACLANWKVGEKRVDMIKRNLPSVKAYWGQQSSIYIDLACQTPEMQYEVKPRFAAVSNVAKRLKERAYRSMSLVEEGIRKKVEEKIEQAKTVLAEEKDIQALKKPGLTLFQKVKSKIKSLVDIDFSPAKVAGRIIPDADQDESPIWDTIKSKIKSCFATKISVIEVDGSESIVCRPKKWVNIIAKPFKALLSLVRL